MEHNLPKCSPKISIPARPPLLRSVDSDDYRVPRLNAVFAEEISILERVLEKRNARARIQEPAKRGGNAWRVEVKGWVKSNK